MARSMTRTVSNEETVMAKDTEEKVIKKKYGQEDLIPCRSLVSGGLYIIGARSNFLYTWADYGDVVDVEYRDLVYMLRSNDKSVFEPRIIIEDEQIVSENKVIEELYNSLYSAGDFNTILNLSIAEMKKRIEQLPIGARDAFKDYVVSMIEKKQLDSIKKVKAIDEYFGTSFLMALTED